MKRLAVGLACALVALAACLRVAWAAAPVPEFSSDTELFLEEMDELFGATADKRKAKDFIKELSSFMLDPTTDDGLKRRIISDCNALRKAKGRPFPNYFNCAKTYFLLAKSNKIEGSNRAVWFEAVDNKLRIKTRMLNTVNAFYLATQDYLEDYTLSRTPSLRWRFQNNGASFRIGDKGQFLIDIPTTRLVCLSQGDSIEVLETHGTFNVDEATWQGSEGLVTWERCNLPSSQTNARFDEYTVDMTKSSFEIDNVRFTNTDYFQHHLVGTLEHKVTSRKTTLGKLYPKFYTKGERMEIKQIFRDIDYYGGFTQVGSTFQGSGTPDNLAEINIFRNDTLFVVAKALSFVFSPDRIESQQARIQLILDDEEITHQGLHFRYMDNKREMHLIRNGEGIARSLYYDTFHKVSMDIEYMRWRLDEPEIELRMMDGSASGRSVFESLAYYRESEYYRIQGMEMTHPFQYIADFWRYMGGEPFYVDDYASYRMLPVSELKQQMYLYSFEGFIDYDDQSGLVTPRERMFDYLQFRLGKKDYDVIKFESTAVGNTPIGFLDLKNYDIRLNSVLGIAISDNQNVALYPNEGKVILKRNRDFKFDGKVDAGMLSLVGSGFYFSYENFNIELNRIDDMVLYVPSNDRDGSGRRRLQAVGNTISDLSGNLQIDEPDNKSGIKYNPQYPRLTSTKESYVYYDAPHIHGGKYKRETFYFAVDPFEFENINDIKPENTNFAGVLHSGIFEPIRHDLTIRKHDNSLGFETQTPAEGLTAYGGPAKFYQTLDLSNRGLRGTGNLTYFASSSTGEDLLFLPEETTGFTSDFTISPTADGVAFPGVELGKNQQFSDGTQGQTKLRFRPQLEELRVENTKGEFLMFTNAKGQNNGHDCELSGVLCITPNGLRGSGRSDMHQATLEARQMFFTDHSIMADTAYFSTYRFDEYGQPETLTGILRKEVVQEYSREAGRLYSTTYAQTPDASYSNMVLKEDAVIEKISKEEPAIHNTLMYNSMLAEIDFAKREGYFTYKADNGNTWRSRTVKYQTQLKHLTWDMERNLQIMGQTGTTGNLFVCTKERGDSLQFHVPVAIFDGIENTLTCEEVKNIKCADANIILDPKTVIVIRQNAEMNALDNSEIELKTLTTYHRIYDAKVKIEGAKKYTAIGNYDFKNLLGETRTVFMGNIFTNDGVTIAEGTVAEDIDLDEHFAFKGKVRVTTPSRFLEYDGGVRMVHNSPNVTKGYIRFINVIDLEQVEIPIGEKVLNYKDEEIYCNFFIRKDSTHVYSSFIESRKDHSDISMLRAEGLLYYNYTFDCFEISSVEKRVDVGMPGTTLRFVPETNRIVGFGKVDLGVMLPSSKPIVFENAGTLYDYRSTNIIRASLLSNIDFFFSTQLATMMYNDILQSDAASCDTSSYRYETRVAELRTEEEIKQMIFQRKLGLDKETQLLPETGSLLTIDNVELLWNTPKQAYICDTTVNLMMMRGRNLNKKVRMKAEYVCKKTGSTIDIELSFGNEFYYFSYRAGNMQVLSSNKEFNQALQKIDVADRRDKQSGLTYTLAPDSRRKRFLANFGAKKSPQPSEPDEGEENADNAEADEVAGE